MNGGENNSGLIQSYQIFQTSNIIKEIILIFNEDVNLIYNIFIISKETLIEYKNNNNNEKGDKKTDKNIIVENKKTDNNNADKNNTANTTKYWV